MLLPADILAMTFPNQVVGLTFDGSTNVRQSYKPCVLKVYFHDLFSCIVFKLTSVLSFR